MSLSGINHLFAQPHIEPTGIGTLAWNWINPVSARHIYLLTYGKLGSSTRSCLTCDTRSSLPPEEHSQRQPGIQSHPEHHTVGVVVVWALVRWPPEIEVVVVHRNGQMLDTLCGLGRSGK
jgi:hypothetical protein